MSNDLQLFMPSSSLVGLPVRSFDYALLWRSQGKEGLQRRRLGGKKLLPSWSWAGWLGGTSYPLEFNRWNRNVQRVMLQSFVHWPWLVSSSNTKSVSEPQSIDHSILSSLSC
jgi:hypothetical protein